MKHRYFKTAIACVALSAVIFQGCKSKEPEQVIDEEITKDTASADAKQNLGLLSVNMPAITEVTDEMNKAGFKYNKSLLNASGKAGSYVNSLKMATNLGVYAADMGYAAAYRQNQDMMEFFGTTIQLADKLGLSSVFDKSLAQRFQNSLNKKDSINMLITMSLDKADRNLRSNKRVSTSALIAAGGWVEGLYIATQSVTTARDSSTEAVYSRIWNHIYSFTYLFNLLDHYKKEADCAKMTEDMKPLAELINNYAKKPKINLADLTALKEKVTTLRNQIVN